MCVCVSAHVVFDAACPQIELEEKELEELVTQEQDMKQAIANGQDKLFRLQRQFEEKRHQAQMALDTVQSERMAVMRVQQKDKQQVVTLNNTVERKRKELERMQSEHNEAVTLLKERYSQLEEELVSFHRRM